MSELDGIRQAGERLTRQRRAVLDVLSSQRGHLTVEQICVDLRGEFPSINTGTVYRVLQWLERHSLVCETDMGTGTKVYERVGKPSHHHLICLECGRITTVDDRYFRPLAAALRQDLGFGARLDHFAVFGTCAECIQAEGDTIQQDSHLLRTPENPL